MESNKMTKKILTLIAAAALMTMPALSPQAAGSSNRQTRT